MIMFVINLKTLSSENLAAHKLQAAFIKFVWSSCKPCAHRFDIYVGGDTESGKWTIWVKKMWEVRTFTF